MVVGEELSNLDVKVGDVLSITGTTIDTTLFSMCASYLGPSTDGATERLDCVSSVIGSVLAIQKTITTSQLTLCEVEVYTEIGYSK